MFSDEQAQNGWFNVEAYKGTFLWSWLRQVYNFDDAKLNTKPPVVRKLREKIIIHSCLAKLFNSNSTKIDRVFYISFMIQ